MIGGLGSPTDPLRPKSDARAMLFTGGRVISTPRLVQGERTLVFALAGQSNISNTVTVRYTPTNTGKVDNLNIFDGGVYRGEDPLLGGDLESGTWASRCADLLINTGVCDRVILIPFPISGSSILSWIPGAIYNDRFRIAGQRCDAVGLSIDAFLWQQGESDHAMAQSTYAAHLMNVIGTPRALGYTAPWIVAKSTMLDGITSTEIRAALGSVVNGIDIFAGPDTDTLVGTTYRYDDTHFNGDGGDAAAALWRDAIAAVF